MAYRYRKWLNDAKGAGFLRRMDGGKDFLNHFSAIQDCRLQVPQEDRPKGQVRQDDRQRRPGLDIRPA